MMANDNNVRMRSMHMHVSDFSDDKEVQSGVHIGDGLESATTEGFDSVRLNESDNGGGAPDPLKLPPSSHSLLFTQPTCSLPYAFSMGIAILSYVCLFLVEWNNMGEYKGGLQDFIPNLPVNISPEVRAAQFLSIIIVLLMEEEIPTGLYLLRMISQAQFEQQFPDFNYSKFVFSSVLRVFMGYFFLFNVFIVLAQATEVIAIFYDVLALQFIQQLDDIAFALAKKDVLGKEMQHACTAKCFQTEFERQKFGRSKKLSICLKSIYFVNLSILLGGMAIISGRQLNGDYHAKSITVDFGNDIWEKALVELPSKFHKEWLELYPFYDGIVTPDEYEKWTLVFSYFNGVYKRDGIHAGRPVYNEIRKSDSTTNYDLIVPARIFYCEGISAWVFAHEFIHKSARSDEPGCNWLLRSEETEEYDLMNVGTKWKIWYGVIGYTEISYVNNECSDDTDCNLNGLCVKGECKCHEEEGVEYLGSHCETIFKEECETIIGAYNETYAIYKWNSDRNPNGPLDTVAHQYGRPNYYLVSGLPSLVPEGYKIHLYYTGSRWFGVWYSDEDLSKYGELASYEAYYNETHAFWERLNSEMFTKYVSDETKKPTPVGVDFYWIGPEERNEQFGPFGALYPVQLQGRGYFRCGGPISSLENSSITGRKLSKIYRGKIGYMR